MTLILQSPGTVEENFWEKLGNPSAIPTMWSPTLAVSKTSWLDDALATAKALNRWQHAVHIPRDHPLVVALGEALGFTQAQLDTEWANVINR